MTSAEIRKLRLGSIILVRGYYKFLVGYYEDQLVLLNFEAKATRENLVDAMLRGAFYYEDVEDLVHDNVSYVGQSRLLTEKDMLCIQLSGKRKEKLLTNETFLELSDYCLGNKIKPLHSYFYEYGSTLQIATKDFCMAVTPIGVYAIGEILNTGLYRDLGYILPSDYGIGWKPYNYVHFASGETGLFVEDNKIGLIKEPVFNITDVKNIERVIRSDSALWQYRSMGYDKHIVMAVYHGVNK